RISVVAGFILKQFWLWLTRRYHRHGYAAVSFGAPVSLNAYLAESPDASVEDLGQRLMDRIGEEVPVLPVPAVAHVLTEADGPISKEVLVQHVGRLVEAVPEAHVHLPRNNDAYLVDVGLRNLRKRGMVTEGPDGIEIAEKDRALVAYYARSIAHLVPR
ncbi:MAG: glycerol-3-phosphate acyltransferase, partial [Pseudomonadota bacterium]